MSEEILFNFKENPYPESEVIEDYKVLAEDIKSQMALWELYKFLKYKRNTGEDSKFKTYMERMRFLKISLMIFYCLSIFFEKPFWCYERNTFNTNINKRDNECDVNVNSIDIITLYPPTIFYRVFEIFILVLFLWLDVKLKLKEISKKKVKHRITIFLRMILISICIIEIIVGLIINYYPMINLVIRSFLIILLNKKLREEWKKIFLIIYQTKSLSFILFINLLIFSLIGHLSFQKDNNEFSTYFLSLNSMFILMTTCNFPDVMFKVIEISDLAIVFFVSYLIVNFFIFLSLLKVLIYTNYIEINKQRILRILKKIWQSKTELNDSDINYITTFKQRFTLSNSEFQKLKDVLKIPQKNVPIMRDSMLSFSNVYSKSQDDEDKKKRYKLLRYLRLKRTEIIVNMINILIIGIAIIKNKNIMDYVIQDLMFLYFILEYVIYIRYYGISKLLRNKMLRSLVCGINLIGFIIITYMMIIYLITDEENLESLLKIGRTFIILRATRIFVLLDTFKEYKIIFTTLRNMKRIFLKMIFTQFSFFLIFSTISMTILGGKIKNDQYIKDESVPNYYAYINFNTFGSSFLTCFCFLIINNTNIQTEAISLVVGHWFKGYFTIFYFMGTVVMLNVFQSIVLDMYVNVKKSKKI